MNIDPKTIMLSKYYNLFDIFFRQKSDKIPLYRTYHHFILLKKGIKHSFGMLYDMNYKKNEELCKYLFKNIDKGFIRASQSLVTLLVLFV